MPDILNTSLTGMLAFQRALAVTSHNISNANTPGYSRQVTDFSSRVGDGANNLYIGGGTQITRIRRMYDAMQVEQLRNSNSGFARFNTLDSLASRIDTFLADADTGLNSSLQSYFGAVQDLANDPSSIPTRQALLGEAQGLAAKFQSLDTRLGELEAEVNDRLEMTIGEVNRLAAGIADLNDRIALTNNATSPANDLLDQRDKLITELSGHVSVTTNLQDDGTMSIFIGSGQPLVLGADAQQLGVGGDEFDMTRMEVYYVSPAGNTPLDTSSTGGNLGGLLEFRSRMLDPARQSLGQTAVAFARSINEQHASGMDLRGNLGSDLFSVADPTVLPSNRNTGTPAAAVVVTDLGQYSGVNYTLEYDGASYTLTRNDTGATVPMTGTGTAADPFLAEGLSIDVTGGAPAAGDRLLIRSAQDAAGSLQSIVSDPQALAVAAPTRSSASLANSGNAQISPAVVSDASDPALLTTAVLEFTSPTNYRINGAGNYTYTDGDPIIINGSEVSITGAPLAGDRFTIEGNYGASGDNSNALLLTGVQSDGILDGGSISINENYGRLVSSVGSTTHQIKAGRDAQGVVLANAENAVLETSGVNLDEEAANLIKYQQAYQAVAQVVSVANSLFDSLLNATSR
ncbi:MAG: flagellar hook-associated protein FlgK [Woeseiaceae bacterium]|nr:flagellar hook-associated protein FlgK [Woeseiaceae bacterium]